MLRVLFLGGNESPKLWSVGSDLSAVSPQQPPGHPSRVCVVKNM